MKAIGLINETSYDTRVALTPQVIEYLNKNLKHQFFIESGCGIKSGFSDEDYKNASAVIVENKEELLQKSQIIIGINSYNLANINSDMKDKIIIGLFYPYENNSQIKKLLNQNATLIALEAIPRISRAQSMDVLSSQANLAGYVSVLLAANKLNRILPMMSTAAGTIKPSKVLVLGAGVAGLSAISTAKRLGAIVYAYDVRPEVKEQVESLGAKFLDIGLQQAKSSDGYALALIEDEQKLQRELLSKKAKDMDIIITTALIPNKKAPLLLDDCLSSSMKENSVIIDMAAKNGGNINLSVLNEWKKIDKIWVYGADSLANQIPYDASFTFSNNVKALLEVAFDKEGILQKDDEIISASLLCQDGQWLNKKIIL